MESGVLPSTPLDEALAMEAKMELTEMWGSRANKEA